MKDIKGYECFYAVISAIYNNTYGTCIKSDAEKHFKLVYCVEPNTEYKSITGITVASELLQISKGNICSVVNRNRKTAGGYHWRWST